jgi:hypothetical protein
MELEVDNRVGWRGRGERVVRDRFKFGGRPATFWALSTVAVGEGEKYERDRIRNRNLPMAKNSRTQPGRSAGHLVSFSHVHSSCDPCGRMRDCYRDAETKGGAMERKEHQARITDVILLHSLGI